MVREVCADQIKKVVRDLFLKANYEIGDDISRTVEQALKNEESPIGCQVLRDIANNNRIAAAERMAICPGYRNGLYFCSGRPECAHHRRSL